jgi:hypothetical protein
LGPQADFAEQVTEVLGSRVGYRVPRLKAIAEAADVVVCGPLQEETAAGPQLRALRGDSPHQAEHPVPPTLPDSLGVRALDPDYPVSVQLVIRQAREISLSHFALQ